MVKNLLHHGTPFPFSPSKNDKMMDDDMEMDKTFEDED